MQQWEHTVVYVDAPDDVSHDSILALLNRHGSDGWELVSFVFRPLVDVKGGTSLGNFILGAGAGRRRAAHEFRNLQAAVAPVAA